MNNKRKVAEQLLDIREKIRILEENPDDQTIMELTKLIQESKAITYQYRLWDAAKAKLEQAYEKLNEAEDLAIDYCRNHKKSPSLDPKIVFDTFLDGIKKMFA
jgi:hypothetical protein